MSDQAASVNSTESTVGGLPKSQDLAQLRSSGRTMSPQELKELAAKIRTFEEMARLEDRLKALENRKRSAPHTREPTIDPVSRRQPEIQSELEATSALMAEPLTTDLDTDSDSDQPSRTLHKRSRITRGIKVTPGYTLKVTSSLREWGDWKRDIERVFEGDPYLYRRSSQMILKALDYLDSSMRSLWYTYQEQQSGSIKWSNFTQWTRDNIQGGQNSIAHLYEQLDIARQLPNQSPSQFNAYLSSIERDLPQKDEEASAMTLYSKLSRDLRKQFQKANIPIPETRAKCVAVAQRIWEGLNTYDQPRFPRVKDDSYSQTKDPKPKDSSDQQSKYPRPDSRRGRINQYRRDHRKESNSSSQVTCFKCKEEGHYATTCPNENDPKGPKIQSTLEHQPESQSPSRSPSPPQEESDNSLN
jgi:hypothetical protein